MSKSFEKIILISLSLILLTTISLFIWVFNALGLGVDFSDEGFYLNWYKNPSIYSYCTTLFGFFYSPLFNLLDGNIILFRRINILIVYALSVFLLFKIIKNGYKKSEESISITHTLILASGFASSAFLILIVGDQWFPNIGYNLLNLQGLLIASIALIYLFYSHNSIGIWILFGVSGYICFMAKPTSALMLGFTVLLWSIFLNKFRFSYLIVSSLVSIALLMATAISIDGSITGTINRFETGLNFIKVFQPNYELFKSLTFKFHPITKAIFIVLSIIVLLSSYFQRQLPISIRYLVVPLALLNMFIIFGVIQPTLPKHLNNGLIAIIAFIPLVVFLIKHFTGITYFKTYTLVNTFIFLPYIFAFGTGNPYSIFYVNAIVFVVAACVVIMLLNNNINKLQNMILYCVLIQFTVIFILFNALNVPYRQPDTIFSKKTPIVSKHFNQSIMVSNGQADFIKGLDKIYQYGFKINTPLIDLTGYLPGVVYFLGGKAIGQSWLLGGYGKASLDAAQFALDRVNCSEITNAWLLTEKNGPIRLPVSILRKYGIKNIKNTYEEVAEVKAKISYIDFNHEKTYIIRKPINPEEAKFECELKRQAEIRSN